MPHKTRGRAIVSDAVQLTPITGTTGGQGVMYYDSVLNKLRVHNGTAFLEVPSPADDITLEESGGSLQIKDGGVTNDKLADSIKGWVLLDNTSLRVANSAEAISSRTASALPVYDMYLILGTMRSNNVSAQGTLRLNGLATSIYYSRNSTTTITDSGPGPSMGLMGLNSNTLTPVHLEITGTSAPGGAGDALVSGMPTYNRGGSSNITFLGGAANLGDSVQVTSITIGVSAGVFGFMELNVYGRNF